MTTIYIYTPRARYPGDIRGCYIRISTSYNALGRYQAPYNALGRYHRIASSEKFSCRLERVSNSRKIHLNAFSPSHFAHGYFADGDSVAKYCSPIARFYSREIKLYDCFFLTNQKIIRRKLVSNPGTLAL